MALSIDLCYGFLALEGVFEEELGDESGKISHSRVDAASIVKNKLTAAWFIRTDITDIHPPHSFIRICWQF